MNTLSPQTPLALPLKHSDCMQKITVPTTYRRLHREIYAPLQDCSPVFPTESGQDSEFRQTQDAPACVYTDRGRYVPVF